MHKLTEHSVSNWCMMREQGDLSKLQGDLVPESGQEEAAVEAVSSVEQMVHTEGHSVAAVECMVHF